jgi:hypothetical protein
MVSATWVQVIVLPLPSVIDSYHWVGLKVVAGSIEVIECGDRVTPGVLQPTFPQPFC